MHIHCMHCFFVTYHTIPVSVQMNKEGPRKLASVVGSPEEVFGIITTGIGAEWCFYTAPQKRLSIDGLC